MKKTALDCIKNLQKDPKNIRNVCILAHVDHGKTTLADVLISSNGIISQKLAGKLRYMDSREDEQLRGITMKSSAISLLYKQADNSEFLINLIDSPGHIDFFGEVSAVVRLCDGGVILVDAVEGVCPQTHSVLRQTWLQNIKPTLVINKIDRLITELKLTPQEAELRLIQLLEQVNAITGELFATDAFAKSSNETTKKTEVIKYQFELHEWLSGVDELDDSLIYFSPDQNNLIFASALDRWGFSPCHFSSFYSKKLGLNPDELSKCLWGDYYYDAKNKTIKSGAKAKGKKSLFVQLILDNIWKIYEAFVNKDKDLMIKISTTLNLKVNIKQTDLKSSLQSIFSQWLPLSKSLLDMICNQLPSPSSISEERVRQFLKGSSTSSSSTLSSSSLSSSSLPSDIIPEETLALEKCFLECSSSDSSPVIAFISKMIPFETKNLPKYKPKPLTIEEINAKREAIIKKRQLLIKTNQNIKNVDNQNNIDDVSTKVINDMKNSVSIKNDDVQTNNQSVSLIATNGSSIQPLITPLESNHSNSSTDSHSFSSHTFIAFSRLFSGTLKKGKEVYVLGPRHNPNNILQLHNQLSEGSRLDDSSLSQLNITRHEISDLYVLMGREVEEIDEVSAGNVLGIGGLEEVVFKTASLSSSYFCPSFSDIHQDVSPIVKVAVEPRYSGDMEKLLKGLKMLNQSDPCVEVHIENTGEHVLMAAGEVHLNKCLEDLRDRFANIEINSSSPSVAFRETIIPPPLVDRVNELISEQQAVAKTKGINGNSLAEMVTSEGWSLRIRAVPIPEEVVRILDKHSFEIKKAFSKISSFSGSNSETDKKKNLNMIKNELIKVLEVYEKHKKGSEDIWTRDVVDDIWFVDLKRDCSNLLINKMGEEYKRPSFFDLCVDKSQEAKLQSKDRMIINGFEMTVECGPLCEEPLSRVAFVVEKWFKNDEKVTREDLIKEKIDELDKEMERDECIYRGSLVSCMKECCRRAFQNQPQRLMWAMYSCVIQATSDILGKMYGVLGKRHGRVLSEEMKEGSSLFEIVAVIPVVESFGFAEEFRKKTSGLAIPQLKFSHWETIDINPYWVPTTEEEYLHFGEKADSENIGRKYMNDVRRRKGLKVQEKLVEFGDKQRTLKKNK